METSFLIFLLIGMVAMFIVMGIGCRTYGIPLWKIAVITALLMPAGYYGAVTMCYIESGSWTGRSLYGAVFLVPIVMLPAAKLLKISYGELMDVCAPAGCIMFALLKVKCKIDGCCKGRMMHIGDSSFVFPSQIVECVVFVIILFIIMYLLMKKQHQHKLYPIFMILYGASRFFLNLLRETTPWIGPLPAGNFWSIVSVLIGITAILITNRSKTRSSINGKRRCLGR